jgi:hypothetical protein
MSRLCSLLNSLDTKTAAFHAKRRFADVVSARHVDYRLDTASADPSPANHVSLP